MITVGYVRLSKEDENRKSNSIENQKLIISQYAEKHGIEIQSWYEDNNISGYLSERPAFQRLLQDLKVDIDTVIVKDLSRLGRKNSMVLSVLDYMAEQGKQMIAIDNHYDSLKNDDDTLGITT